MKKIISIFICFQLTFLYPSLLWASAAEKWTIEEISYDNVAKNIKIQAEKNYGPSANDNKYKVKVPVSASSAGSTALSMIRMGVAGAALYGLVEGVGWIIENGVVKKLDPDTVQNPDNVPYGWSYGGNTFNTDPDALCKSAISNPGDGMGGAPLHLGLVFVSPQQYGCKMKQYGRENINVYINKVPNPNYNPDVNPPKYIPVSPSEMGEEIIDSPAAPQILPTIYNPNNPVRPSPAPDAADKALENAPPIPKQNPNGDTKPKPNEDTDGDGEPDVFNPEKPSVGTEFTLPEFCSWAVTVCEWYTKYKEDSDLTKEHREAEKQVWSQEEIARQEEKQQREDEKSFWQKVEDWFDWSREEPDLTQDETDLPIDETPLDRDPSSFDTSYVTFGAQCPVFDSYEVSVGPISKSLSMDLTPLCQFAEKVRPAILGMSYLTAAGIVVAAIRET